MPNINPNSTNYRHSFEPNTNDLVHAMDYNSLGQPCLRTTSGAAPTSNDAFGRSRVSSPYTLFDSFHRYQDNGKIGTLAENGASSVHDASSSTIVNTVTGTASSRVVRESLRTFAYQPGKSLQILETFCLAPAVVGLRQRYGFFDADNGIYLEQDDTTYYLVRRSSSSGSLINTRIAQTDWNIDPLDGTGTSRISIDFTRAQIMFIDIEWLGVGSVRCGFVIDGEFVLAHIFHHANTVTTTYMTTACLPIRAEIENTATNDVTSSLRVICATVISEGGYELRGRSRSIGHRITAPRTTITAQNGVILPMISIRLKADRLGAIVIPTNFSFGAITGANYEFYIINGATTSGGSWDSAGTDSSVEYNLTPTSYTGGTLLDQGYVISTNQSSVSPTLKEYPFAFQLERNTLTSPATRYEFLIATATTTNSTSQVHSISWEEIT
jgi:hypothetical protein